MKIASVGATILARGDVGLANVVLCELILVSFTVLDHDFFFAAFLAAAFLAAALPALSYENVFFPTFGMAISLY